MIGTIQYFDMITVFSILNTVVYIVPNDINYNYFRISHIHWPFNSYNNNNNNNNNNDEYLFSKEKCVVTGSNSLKRGGQEREREKDSQLIR